MTTKNPEIVGLGVSTLDLLMRVDEFPGEETVQKAEESALQGGGPVSTAIVAAACLGARTQMIDRIGSDWRGDQILREYREFGVGMDGLIQVPGSSSLASIWVRNGDGARTIAYSPGSCGELIADELPDGIIEEARILHLNGRHWAAGMVAARRAREAGVKVSFDGGAGRYREEVRELLPLLDIAIVAREWAERFSGATDLISAADMIRNAGPALVGITCGTRGAWIFPPEGGYFHQPAFKTAEVVDTTGCGDVWHGAFLNGLARDWSLDESARLASAMAALNTRGLGGRGNLQSLDSVRAFADEAETYQ